MEQIKIKDHLSPAEAEVGVELGIIWENCSFTIQLHLWYIHGLEFEYFEIRKKKVNKLFVFDLSETTNGTSVPIVSCNNYLSMKYKRKDLSKIVL